MSCSQLTAITLYPVIIRGDLPLPKRNCFHVCFLVCLSVNKINHQCCCQGRKAQGQEQGLKRLTDKDKDLRIKDKDKNKGLRLKDKDKKKGLRLKDKNKGLRLKDKDL